MIDIQSRVITAVTNALEAVFGSSFPDLNVSEESVDVPEAFPCVTVEEIFNSTYTPTQDEELEEHYATIGYAVNVYTNNTMKKATAQQIANIADLTMQAMKFNRTFKGPTPNVDRTIYRITMRYEAIVGQPVERDGEDVYPMYRR